ncbi:MAG TPA: META domain-containing protein [Rhodoferax sp.]|nr:META domain-containing protein [Rhodoferax sp.]
MSICKSYYKAAALLACAPFLGAALASEPQLICFGNEPSWSLQFSDLGRARLIFPDQKAIDIRGQTTRIEYLSERAWRGKARVGKSGDVVAFLRESTCSDGMSDTKHPLTARVSLPDSRLLAGCCRVPASSNAAPSAAVTMEGNTWQLAALDGKSLGAAGMAGRPVTARFEGGRVSGFSGCNQFTGAYTLDRDSLVIGPLAATMMACPEPQMALEKAVNRAFTGTLRHAIVLDHLSLTPASGTPMVFQLAPAPKLEGVKWSVTGFNNGRQAVVGPLLGTTLTLTFGDGQVQGSSGCNTFRSVYTSEGNRLKIGPAISTRMACSREGVMQQEREFLAALESATVWTITGGMLDVHRADGERVLNAIAIATAP